VIPNGISRRSAMLAATDFYCKILVSFLLLNKVILFDIGFV